MKSMNQTQMEKFITYYNWKESPNPRILELFQEIKKRDLSKKIYLLCEDEMDLQNNMILIQNNGIMIWNEMNPHLDVIGEALSFIMKNEQTCICLQTKVCTEEQNLLQEYAESGATVGQYAMRVKRLERNIEKKKQGYQSWHQDFESIKKNKIDSVLDRYHMQHQLFQMFGDEKYKKRMEKWESIFFIMTTDSYFA